MIGFGELRSLFNQHVYDQGTFDDLIRHLLNNSWLEDPRVFEQWFDYAVAHVHRWPDSARQLYVRPPAVMFLENIDRWSPLVRALCVADTKEFVEQMIYEHDEGAWSGVRALRLRSTRIGAEAAGRLGELFGPLEGLVLGEFDFREAECDAFFGALDLSRLRWLDVGGVYSQRDVARWFSSMPALEILRLPGGALRRHGLSEHLDVATLPNLRSLSIGSIEVDDLALLVEEGDFEALHVTGSGGYHVPARLLATIERRGWTYDVEDGVGPSVEPPFTGW